MEDSNSFYACFYKTTITGKHIYTVHGTDDELNAYSKSIQKNGRTVAYLTLEDQVTPILNDAGQKIPLHFSQDKPVGKLMQEKFPIVQTMTGLNKGSFNPDLRLVRFVNDNIKEYGPSHLAFCIDEARASLAHANAQDFQETDNSGSVPTPEPSVAVKPSAKALAKSALAKKTKKQASE